MTDLIIEYNYDVFKPENYNKWMNWDASPKINTTAPDFPLWHLDGTETHLSDLWREHRFLVVEFGSFT